MKKDTPGEQDKGIPAPRGEVSEYIYQTDLVLEEHTFSAKSSKAASAPWARLSRMPWVFIGLGILVISAVYLFLKN